MRASISLTRPRCIALVGPFQSGKTTLLEAILGRTGMIQRQGVVDAGTTVGDASKKARHHKMSVELTRHHRFHGIATIRPIEGQDGPVIRSALSDEALATALKCRIADMQEPTYPPARQGLQAPADCPRGDD